MSGEGRPKLVLAIYLQTRGFAFVLFETWNNPVDWAVHDIRGPEKNTRCRKRIESMLSLHTPDVVVLQDMSGDDAGRAPRIQKLNREIARLAERREICTHMVARAALRELFADHFGATTKQKIAEAIVYHISALGLYVPPPRKPWKSQDGRMGLFEAAALAWMYFHACDREHTVVKGTSP
jgi:hypothetical protein